MINPSIGIVIPTFQAAAHLNRCLAPLVHSQLKPKILIIDSSSSDATVEVASSFGVETIVIPKKEYNHGATREMGRKHLGTDIIVMMTQDAYPASMDMLDFLIQPLMNNGASISYARQIPHHDADFFAAFLRKFNYPDRSHVRSLHDVAEYGAYTFFCSNSCAAYQNAALNEIGGFPTIAFGEDTTVTAQLLIRQHRIAYVAEAEIYHSHNYTLKEEFCRHYHIGRSRKQHADLLQITGQTSARGKAYVRLLLKELWEQHPHLIPYACMHILSKWSGYYLGHANLWNS